ncbi:histidinol-phosphate transaminase [Haliangium sp.]|uniref:histidinol-phosphate transaminase n=1 Tax=Haliangium sp. TaxID=2663208 RepID=UPI003D0E1FDA
MSSFFDTLAPDHIRELRPYQPGRPIEEVERELGITGAIKIASNENPLGPSPRAVEAATQALATAHLYPDGGAFYLRRALAERRGVTSEQLVFGAGSNELIYLILMSMCRPGQDEVLSHQFSFLSYRLAAKALNLPIVEASVSDDLSCDPDALIAAMGPRTKVVLLANPNNPTGSRVPTADFERILAALPPQAVLVMDEAYLEYAIATEQADDHPLAQSYIPQDPRIISLRTFSKIYGLAGLRVGYGIGHPDVISVIERVRRPFNVNSVAQAAALAALDDEEHVARSQTSAQAGIAVLTEAARGLGLRPYPSWGNFMLVGLGRDAAPVYEALMKKGVIVRPMGAWGLPEHLRISIGTETEIERVSASLAAVLG